MSLYFPGAELFFRVKGLGYLEWDFRDTDGEEARPRETETGDIARPPPSVGRSRRAPSRGGVPAPNKGLGFRSLGGVHHFLTRNP